MFNCSLCEAFYVGRTKCRLQDWLTEHRYAAKIGDYAMVKHFKESPKDSPTSFTAMG